MQTLPDDKDDLAQEFPRRSTQPPLNASPGAGGPAARELPERGRELRPNRRIRLPGIGQNPPQTGSVSRPQRPHR
ncbi:MAG: hypothetical protein QOH03_2316 [Kribbellaceae bacterium]|nr:hypothetical protein [Kribbellaceae bacterium]